MLKKVWPTLLAVAMILVVAGVSIQGIRKSPGLWYVHDDVHVARTLAFAEELQSGQFPVRLASSLARGGGYPIFNFYSPMVYYPTALAVLSGVNIVNAVKLAYQLAFILAGIGTYFLLRKTNSSQSVGVFGAALVITSTYFNYDVYHRGALAELWGFTAIPWLFMAYQAFRTTKKQIWLVVLAVAISLICWLHAPTALITLPFLVLWVGFDSYRKICKVAELKKIAISFFLGLLLSASYLLPVMLEKQYVGYESSQYVTYDVREAIKSPREIFGFANNPPEILPVTLGANLSVLFLLASVFLIFRWKKLQIKRVEKTYMYFVGAAWLAVFFIQSKLSVWFWNVLPLIHMVQFPYRYLSLFTVLTIMAICFVLNHFTNRKWLIPLLIMFVGFSILINRPFSTPTGYYFADTFMAADGCGTTTHDETEFMPIWVKDCAEKDEELYTASEGVTVENVVRERNNLHVAITASGSGTIKFNKYFFPGWTVTRNGQSVEPSIHPVEGVMEVPIGLDTTEVVFSFGDTPVRSIGNYLSLLGLILAMGWTGWIICKKPVIM